MTVSAPLVSVIIPAYNRAHMIERTLRSVMSQTYPEVEIIVVDDGSTDGTRTVVENVDKNIRYIYQQNAGTGSARNTGFHAARGEFISFLDSDDWLLSNKLALQVGYLMANPQIDLVLCGWRDLDVNGKVLGELASFPVDEVLRITLLHRNNGFIPVHSPLIRRGCVEKHGLFDETLRNREDQEYWIRLALEGCKFGLVPEILCVCESRAETRGKDRITLQPIMEIILRRVFSSPTLPPAIAAMKSDVYARSYLSFAASAAQMTDDPLSEHWKNMRGYIHKAFAGKPDIQNWQLDTVDPLLYVSIKKSPGRPAEALLSYLPAEHLEPQIVRYLLSRLYTIQFWEAFGARKRLPALKSLARAVRYYPRILLQKGVLAAGLRSWAGVYWNRTLTDRREE